MGWQELVVVEPPRVESLSVTIQPPKYSGWPTSTSTGRIVGLVGANGGGKSTLLRTIVGLYLPDKGSCTTFGREAGKLRPEDLALAVQCLLRLSPRCLIPEISFLRPDGLPDAGEVDA